MRIYWDTDFDNMTEEEIIKWIDIHKHKLVGSAIFTANKSLISKIVRFAENKGKNKTDGFVPSHVGSIVEQDGEIYLFNMKMPKASKILLEEYICTTPDTFALVMRDFVVNEKQFSADILEYEGVGYAYMSAIRSLLKIIPSKFARHCSEIHCRALQKQGLYGSINPECHPLDLWKIMVK